MGGRLGWTLFGLHEGGETTLVGRPGFKPGGRRHALSGGFDSHSPPPSHHPCPASALMDGGFDSLDFPGHLHYLIEHQVWARDDGSGRFTVGITALGIALAGEIYMCRAKEPGAVVEQGRSIAVVELAKSIVSVKSPLTGVVREINGLLAREPERVHVDPYQSGWIAQIEVSAASGIEQLLHGPAVRQAMLEHARLYRIDSHG